MLMQYFTERGYSEREILSRLEHKYGSKFRIMTRKNIPMGGIMGLFRKQGWEYFGFVSDNLSSHAQAEQARDEASKQDILQRFASNTVVKELMKNSTQEISFNPKTTQNEITTSPREKEDNQEILLSIERMFEEKLSTIERKISVPRLETDHPTLRKVREHLYENEFPPHFVNQLVDSLKKELSLEVLGQPQIVWEEILLKLSTQLKFYNPQESLNKERIFTLVGPTGVGKTTTIAKLAAQNSIAAIGGKRKVHLITLDNYRIGAQQQIKTYGEILQIPVDCAENYEELEELVRNDTTSDLILIDTIGRNPKDYIKLAEMRKMIEACGGGEIHLAVSSTSSASLIKETITLFAPFNFQSIVLTKLDEAVNVGNIISSVIQSEKAISYITTGQRVPQDIMLANNLKLLKKINNIDIDWDIFTQKLEESCLYYNE